MSAAYSSDAKRDEGGGDVKKDSGSGSGCTPTCDTDATPKVCKMPKQKTA